MTGMLTAMTWDDDAGGLRPVEYTLRSVFESPYETCGPGVECVRLIGSPFSLRRVIDRPDDEHDAEMLPMFEIDIAGQTIEAWPEEVTIGATWRGGPHQ